MGVMMALALLIEQQGRGQLFKNVEEIVEEYTTGGGISEENKSIGSVIENQDEARENLCKEPKSYTPKELQQLELNELQGYYANLGEMKKWDQARLQVLVNHKSQINDERILEAIVNVESGGNFLISSRGNGAGLMQLTWPAVTSTLATLYSGRKMYAQFNEKHMLEVVMKKEYIDALMEGYFSQLEYVVKRADERKTLLKHEEELVRFELRELKKTAEQNSEVEMLQQRLQEIAREKKKIELLGKTIVNGYLISNPEIEKKYNSSLAKLQKDENLNEYVYQLTGISRDWKMYIGQQQTKMKEVMKKVRAVEHPELNVLMGDLALAKEIDYFESGGGRTNPLRDALQAYNEGRYGYIERGGAKASAPYYGRFVNVYHGLFGTNPPKFPSTTTHKVEQVRQI
jgi:hypothetical protein